MSANNNEQDYDGGREDESLNKENEIEDDTEDVDANTYDRQNDRRQQRKEKELLFNVPKNSFTEGMNSLKGSGYIRSSTSLYGNNRR